MSEKYELCLRLNSEERQRLQENAKLCGITKTAYLRRLILNTTPKARPTAEMQALRTEIHHIGNNVNQIAHAANMGIATKEDIKTGLFLLEKVYERLGEILEE